MTVIAVNQAVKMIENQEWGAFKTACQTNKNDSNFLPELFTRVTKPKWIKENPDAGTELLMRAEFQGHKDYQRFSEMAVKKLPIQKVMNDVFNWACDTGNKDLANRAIKVTLKTDKKFYEQAENNFVRKVCQQGWKDLAEGILIKKVGIMTSKQEGVQKLWDKEFSGEKKTLIISLLEKGNINGVVELAYGKKVEIPKDIDYIKILKDNGHHHEAALMCEWGYPGSAKYALLPKTDGPTVQLQSRDDEFVKLILEGNIDGLLQNKDKLPKNIDWVGAALELDKDDVAKALFKANVPGADRYVELKKRTGASNLFPKEQPEKPSKYAMGLYASNVTLIAAAKSGGFKFFQAHLEHQDLDWISLAQQLGKDDLAKQLFDAKKPGHDLHKGEFSS